MKALHAKVLNIVVALFSLSNLALAAAQTAPLSYTFENGDLSGPQTISVNGFQNITFFNGSDGEVDMTLTRLDEGATLGAYEAADKAINEAFSQPEGDARQPLKELLEFTAAIGGVHLLPQSEGSAYLNLEPGSYVVSASSGGGPGDPYQARNLLVSVTEGERADAPKADLNIEMVDYHFDVPKTLPAGKSLWQISNAGKEPHFALIFKLNEGATAKDVTSWMVEMAGPPPFSFGTLLPAVTSGETYYTPVDLTPGSYAVICPLPSLSTGAPHFMEGMVASFTVE